MSGPVAPALARLRADADTVQAAFPTLRWTRVDGPGPDELELDGSGAFRGLALEPGRELHLRCRLGLPSQAAGVPLAGDRLEATVSSLYPIGLELDGRPVFEDAGVPVAAGPALATVAPELREGDNGRLDLRVSLPRNQTYPWLYLRLTTPGLAARFERLDVAWAQLFLADRLAATPEEREAVRAAAGLVPESPLRLTEAELAVAMSTLEERLSPLAARAAELGVHVIGHSHIDLAWLWTWDDTREVIQRDVRSVLALMEEFPEFRFTHSQPVTYELLRREAPELFALVLERVREGRWEAATLTWVEGDTNLASSEALARQLLEGVRFSREVLGVQPTTYLAPDNFGHAGNLPQLAASAGARRYYHHRANPGGADPWPAYRWEGQDGTTLVALTTGTYNGGLRARDLAEAAAKALEHGHRAALHLHGVGDHGGGPTRQGLEALRRFRARPGLPAARCSTLEAYADALDAAGSPLPVHRGELGPIFEGCYTTHADTKRLNRRGENLLATADALLALAGREPGAGLRDAWRAVLFGQFHDIVCGSSIPEVYRDQARAFEAVEAAAAEATASALEVLEGAVEPGRIAVTNPLGWDREDWVEFPGLAGSGAVWLEGDHGHRAVGQYGPGGLGFVARVAAFATVAYRVLDAPPEPLPPPLEAVPAFAPTDDRQHNPLAVAAAEPPYLRVETPAFSVLAHRASGVLASFLDRRAGRELVGFGTRRPSDYHDAARLDLALNVLQLVEEHPHAMSAWHLDDVHAEASLVRGATTQVLEAGPARLVLEVSRRVRSSAVEQRIVFYRALDRVDFETTVDWQEPGGPEAGVPNLMVAFTARLGEAEAWFETPFAAVRRPSDGQQVPALRWADVGGPDYGIAVLNDRVYGHDALGGRLRLNLVRTAYDPDPVSDRGRREFRYGLMPHPGHWADAGVPRAAAGFNQPLVARVVGAGRAPVGDAPVWRPRLSGDASVVLAGLKRAHAGGGTVLRLYESAGRTGDATLEGLPVGARVLETSVVEDALGEVEVAGGRARLSFGPWQVRTFFVADPPSA